MPSKINMLVKGAVAAFLFLGLIGQLASADILEDVFERVPYVNLEQVFQEYQRKNDIELQLQTELETEDKILREKIQELEKLRQDYEAQRLLLTETARREREQEINEKLQELQNLQQEIIEYKGTRENQATESLLQDIYRKIEEVAEKEGYVYVFDKAALLYTAPTQDVTERIIGELNREYEAKQSE